MAGETILVVDDEQEIVQLIQLYLAREGYKVISANNGQDVFGIVKEHRPDLIILDILLPGLDGIEVVDSSAKRAIRQSCSFRVKARILTSFLVSAWVAMII